MSVINFSARTVTDAASTTSQCAVLPLFNGAKLSDAAAQLDNASSGAITAALAVGDFTAASGQALMLPGHGKVKRLLLIGCGDQKKFDRSAVRSFCQQVYLALAKSKAKDATLHLAGLAQNADETRWMLSFFARQLTVSSYRYTETLSKPRPAMVLARLSVNTANSVSNPVANKALSEGHATGIGINEARELADLPGNICTPAYLASHARKLCRGNSALSASIVEEKKMRELGMGSLLSVSAGSREAAKLIIINYSGGKKGAKPHVLVGKGITFDSGGISLKPGAKMDEMKYDMGGAASVFGTLRTVAELKLPINVIGIIPAAENMPSSTATKPGDVVTSMAGKTIEVLNTDAEGRLVLCDALTYAARFKPETVIDIATLTGACVVALGSHATGLFANEDNLADQLLSAGTESHDRAWRMPLWDDYGKQLKSNFADLANIGGPGAGCITAACFLSEFTSDYAWAHLDIAGSAWNSSPKGATGRPVALLSRYLMDRAGH